MLGKPKETQDKTAKLHTDSNSSWLEASWFFKTDPGTLNRKAGMLPSVTFTLNFVVSKLKDNYLSQGHKE